MGKGRTEQWLVALRGRRQWREADAERVLNALEASGESVATFARRVGFVAQRLFWWRERLGRKGGAGGGGEVMVTREARPALVPVTVRAPLSLVAGRVVVATGDGLRIEVNEIGPETAAWVATMVRSVQERS